MFRIRKRSGGNRFTFISIILILAVIYISRLAAPQTEAAYPDTIHYDGQRYLYVETVNSSPFMHSRKKPASEEGYMILARRGINIKEEVYVYEGYLKYRRYVVMKE